MKITRKITVIIAFFVMAIIGIASCGKDSDKAGDAFEGVWKLKAIVQNGTVIDVTQAHLPMIGRTGMEKVLPRFPPTGNISLLRHGVHGEWLGATTIIPMVRG